MRNKPPVEYQESAVSLLRVVDDANEASVSEYPAVLQRVDETPDVPRETVRNKTRRDACVTGAENAAKPDTTDGGRAPWNGSLSSDTSSIYGASCQWRSLDYERHPLPSEADPLGEPRYAGSNPLHRRAAVVPLAPDPLNVLLHQWERDVVTPAILGASVCSAKSMSVIDDGLLGGTKIATRDALLRFFPMNLWSNNATTESLVKWKYRCLGIFIACLEIWIFRFPV